MTTARTYILRLYRRPRNGEPRLAGVVEFVPGGRRRSFNSFEELKAILCPPVRAPAIRGNPSPVSVGGALPTYRSSKRR